MNIEQCYRILKVAGAASNEDISKSYKALAMKYHPDRNPHNREWANEQMTILNTAYSSIMSFRFKENAPQDDNGNGAAPAAGETGRYGHESTAKQTMGETGRKSGPAAEEGDDRYDELVNRFVRIREDAKDSLYKYFQYGLYNFHRREDVKGSGLYNGVVTTLRRSYHRIQKLSGLTKNRELLEHFTVFSRMIFDFYRSSECLNVIDSYNDQYEVDSWRMYRKGDELLHQAHREIFFDRHNRGYFISSRVLPDLAESERVFRGTLKAYPDSSWAVETAIKLEYISSLKKYLELFFT